MTEPGLRSRIQIRICIESYIRIRFKAKIQSLEAQYGDTEGCGCSQWRRGDQLLQIRMTRIRIRIKVKRCIWIRITVMRIRNPGQNNKLL
jgi:hypothetical protein